MGKKSRRTKDPWLREACEQWYRLRVGSATTTNRHALTMLRLVAITMHSIYHLPGSLAACVAYVCACILHGAARKSTVQATVEGAEVHIKGLSKDVQFNGRIGHITGTTADGRFAVKIMGGKILAVKIEHLEVRADGSTGFASNQGASDLPEDSNRSKERNGICQNLAPVVEAASCSVSQAPFWVAAAPLLLTKMSVQCCKAIIRAAARSPLLPLFAIAATTSAMCEAAAAKSSNTDTETMLYAHTSHFSGLCNSVECSTFISHLFLWRFFMVVPMVAIVMMLAVPRKLFTRVDKGSNSYSKQCVDVDDWLNDTIEELDKVTSKTAHSTCISRSVDDVDGSRHVEEDNELERKAGKSAFYEEEEGETEDLGGLLSTSLSFDPFDPMPPSLQMQRSAASKSSSERTTNKQPGELTPVLKGHSKDEAKELQSNQCIFLKPPEGGLITVSFYPSKTVFEVKREIKHRLGLDPSDYSLYINAWCKRLDKDNLSLSDYGIGKDSTLVINYASLLGGAGKKRGRPPKEGALSAADKQAEYRKRMTAEKKEAVKARNTSSRREARQARKATAVNQAGSFATTELWEEPGWDYKFKDFQDDPELSALLFYANNGSWRNREPQMLTACLRLLDKLRDSINDDADSEHKLCNLIALCRESIEDKVSLLRVVHEYINESDWKSIKAWQVENGVNSSEMAALDWLVTKGLDSSDDYKQLRDKREPAPILDSWARSLIGMQLKVPGWWWTRKSNSKKYDCEIVDVEYKDKAKRYFWIYCDEDNDSYPMAYVDVKKYSRGVEQKSGRRFDLPKKAYPNAIDENFEKLCKDTLEDLKASNCENDDVIKKCREFVIKRTNQILDSQLVKPEKQRELGQKFLEAQGRGSSWSGATKFNEENFESVDAPLLTCASCGFRCQSTYSMDEDVKSLFKDKDVKSLCWAELDDDKRSEHLAKMGKPSLRLPINDKGDKDDFEPWKAYSRWPAEKPDELAKDSTLPDWMFCENDNGELDRNKPKYFHLHPEFVQEFTDDDDRKDFKAKLCLKCCDFEPNKKSKAPIRSIARGVDFGSPVRVGLVRLTPRERQMISKVRHYNSVTKIESNTGRQREHSHSAIKGHSILFDHDSPRVIRDLLSEESINDSIGLQFVGPDGQYDQLAKKALGSAHVSARPFAVYQWLSVLGEVSEIYSVDRPLDDFPIVAERIHKCNKALVKNAEIVIPDKDTAKETDAARDDIREVRVSSGHAYKGSQSKKISATEVSDKVDEVSLLGVAPLKQLVGSPFYCYSNLAGCMLHLHLTLLTKTFTH